MSTKNALNDSQIKLLNSLNDNKGIPSTEFVEKFAESLYETQNDGSKKLSSIDGSIKSFAACLHELNRLKSRVGDRIRDYASASKQVQNEYHQKSNHLREKFAQVLELSRHLEDNVNDMRSGLVDAGQELERAENNRKRILSSAELLRYYLEFRSGKPQTLMDFFRTNNHDKMLLCAQRTRQLLALANEVDLPDSSETLARIEKFSEFLETNFLKFFNNEYRKPNWKGMASFGTILQEFNGGASVVREFVNQHEFFIAADKVQSRQGLEQDPIWLILPDPTQKIPPLIQTLSSLFSELCSVIEGDCAVIKRVFPNPELVLQTFFQRIFGQSIQNRLEEVMEIAKGKSNLAYLRTLQTVVSSLRKLVADLKTILENRGFSVSDNSPLSLALNQYMEDLLVPFIEVDDYLKREEHSLRSLFRLSLYKYTSYKIRLETPEPGLLRSLMTPLQGNMVAPTGVHSQFNTKTEGFLLRIADIQENLIQSGSFITEDYFTIEKNHSHLNSEKVYSFIGWHAEALNRASILISSQDLSVVISSLVNLLDKLIREDYVFKELSSIQSYISSHDKSKNLDLHYLVDIRECKKIMGYFSAYLMSIVIPFTGVTASSRRETVNILSSSISVIECAVNDVFYATVHALGDHLEIILSPYRQISYAMTEEQIDSSTELRQSMTRNVQNYLDYIKNLYHRLGPYDPSLLALKQKTATMLAARLISFAFRSKVTAAGALLLQNDINFFHSTLTSWGIDTVDAKFKLILQLLSLLMVKIDVLPAVMQDKRKAGFSEMNIHEVLRLRFDLPENLKLQLNKEEALLPPKSS
ncbi:Exocyst complex component sec10 [Schizosaccharomyces pombe]